MRWEWWSRWSWASTPVDGELTTHPLVKVFYDHFQLSQLTITWGSGPAQPAPRTSPIPSISFIQINSSSTFVFQSNQAIILSSSFSSITSPSTQTNTLISNTFLTSLPDLSAEFLQCYIVGIGVIWSWIILSWLPFNTCHHNSLW